MNNWIFRIKFSGLTAFVMRPGDSRPGARVFMVNALGETGKRHVPELRFDDRDWIKDIATSPWKIPLPTTRFDEAFPIATTEFDEALPKTKRRWSLGCLDLNFLPAPGVTLNQPFELDPSIDTYLLRLMDIMSNAGAINPGCFDPDPRPAHVAIQVPLKHGKLTTTTLAFEPSGYWVECGFAPKGLTSATIDWKQYCAIEVTLEFVVEEGPLTLIGVPFDNTSISGIAFRPPSGKREVVVELENRPHDKEATAQAGDGREVDVDFSLYYNLSQRKPIDDSRVVPLYDPPTTISSRPIVVESGNCILARFADDQRA